MLVVAFSLLAARPARADDAPVFDGPPAITRYTKELALELTGGVGGAGPAAGIGSSVSAFYARWLAGFAGATYSPAFAAPRERWEARAGSRLVYPEPLFGNVFGFVVAGGGLLFTSANEAEGTYARALVGVAGVGLFTNLGERVRLRFELREHLRLFGTSDTIHNEVAGLSLCILSR